MDEQMKKIFELVMLSLATEADTTTIGQIVWEHKRSYDLECTDLYKDYTIQDFLNLCIIRILNSEGIITNEVALSLERLYYMWLEISKKIGDLANENLFKYKSSSIEDEKIKARNRDVMDDLYNKSDRIRAVLDKYHLLFSEEDYQRLFQTSFINMEYPTDNLEEIKQLLKQ